ncbi:MAG: PadR family transcriptional regulator [Acidimicrobiales bacterium]
MGRRKKGELIAIEVEILGKALELSAGGGPEFHGFRMARELREGDGSDALIGHGTLYKALSRLETAGMLESSWEDPDAATEAGRPRRRLYRITSDGRLAAVAALEPRLVPDPPWHPGIEPA